MIGIETQKKKKRIIIAASIAGLLVIVGPMIAVFGFLIWSWISFDKKWNRDEIQFKQEQAQMAQEFHERKDNFEKNFEANWNYQIKAMDKMDQQFKEEQMQFQKNFNAMPDKMFKQHDAVSHKLLKNYEKNTKRMDELFKKQVSKQSNQVSSSFSHPDGSLSESSHK